MKEDQSFPHKRMEEEEWLYYTIIIPVEGVKMIKCGAWIRLAAKKYLISTPFSPFT